MDYTYAESHNIAPRVTEGLLVFLQYLLIPFFGLGNSVDLYLLILSPASSNLLLSQSSEFLFQYFLFQLSNFLSDYNFYFFITVPSLNTYFLHFWTDFPYFKNICMIVTFKSVNFNVWAWLKSISTFFLLWKWVHVSVSCNFFAWKLDIIDNDIQSPIQGLLCFLPQH